MTRDSRDPYPRGVAGTDPGRQEDRGTGSLDDVHPADDDDGFTFVGREAAEPLAEDAPD